MSKSSVNYIPEGFHNVTPLILVENVENVVKFAEQAFDAQLVQSIEKADGSMSHVTIKVGDSMIMFGATCNQSKPMPTCLTIYVKDANASYDKAIKAGGKSLQEPKDMFWGDHAGGVSDPEGNMWWACTKVEDLSDDEIQRRALKEEEKMKSQPQKKAA